jgi:hypothetical protein
MKEDSAQVLLLSCVDSVWSVSEFHLHLHIDKLMSLKLVTFDTIVKWIFLTLSKTETPVKVYWRLLFLIIDKVIARTNFIKSTYLQSKENSDKPEEDIAHIEKCY